MGIRIPTSQVIVRIRYNNTCQMFITGPGIQLLLLLISFRDFSPDPTQLLVYTTRILLLEPRRDTLREGRGDSAFLWDTSCLCCSLLQLECIESIRLPMASYKCFQSTRRGFLPLRTLAGDEDPSFSSLTQAILTKKSLSHCDILFRFLTVGLTFGLTVWEGAQTAKVGLDQALPSWA